MKVKVTPDANVAGIAPVFIEFVSDNGEQNVRPPMIIHVLDEGGSVLVAQNACREAMKKLPESETEARAAIQAWIDRWDSIPERGSAA